ncbi:MAG: hypothetical protein F4X74_07390 [Acidimicrobiia bacterium]|nr:hypothetical protein [Acidimicrobiia bacterium]
MIQPAQAFGEIPSHEQRSRLQERHVPDHVELLLIDLPALEARVREPEHIGGPAHGQQPVGMVGIEDLRTDHGRLQALGGVDQGSQGVGSGSGPGVQHPQVVHRTVDSVQGLREPPRRLGPGRLRSDVRALVGDDDHVLDLVDLGLDACQHVGDLVSPTGHHQR